jgi:hypothetical protein
MPTIGEREPRRFRKGRADRTGILLEHLAERLKQQWATKPSTKPKKMTEYFFFLSACIGLTLSLIGLWLWLHHQRRS